MRPHRSGRARTTSCASGQIRRTPARRLLVASSRPSSHVGRCTDTPKPFRGFGAEPGRAGFTAEPPMTLPLLGELEVGSVVGPVAQLEDELPARSGPGLVG